MKVKCPHCELKIELRGLGSHIRFRHKESRCANRGRRFSKRECEKCHQFVSVTMFTRHVRACKGNIVNTIQESWKQENGKYRCPYCKTEKTKAGIGSHIWHKHTEKGRVFKPTKGSKRVVSDLTRANISKSLRGHSVSKKTRDSLSVRMKEKNPAKSLNVRQKLSKVAIRSNAERLENGTHNLLRDRNNAKNFFFERLFDKILYTENFVTDAIRVCSIAMKVVRDYDENLQEIYRDKVAFEFDWLNEKLGN